MHEVQCDHVILIYWCFPDGDWTCQCDFIFWQTLCIVFVFIGHDLSIQSSHLNTLLRYTIGSRRNDSLKNWERRWVSIILLN